MDLNNLPNPSHKIYYIIAGVIIVVVLILVFGLNTASKKAVSPVADPGANFQVNKVDLSQSATKLPAAWPSFVPVETSQAVQSQSVDYPNAKTTQLTYSYLSSDTVKNKYKTYQNLTNIGFKIVQQDSSKGSIYLTKNNDTLSVNITTQEGKTLVQLTYLKRD